MLKILIADDEQIERRYLKNLLQKHRALYQIVGEAATGEEVLKLTSQLKPDVIIMDINMPSMNGLDSANLIKKKYPNICILLNTAYAEFEFARRALEYGLDAYLLKNSKLSIQEIAVSCGFPNLSHFDRVFKQQTGMSPVSYRNN